MGGDAGRYGAMQVLEDFSGAAAIILTIIACSFLAGGLGGIAGVGL